MSPIIMTSLVLAVAADLNQNGKPDLVAIASRSNNLVWYENRSQ